MRTYDHNLLRFKLLMGMLVWSHKEAGIRFHNNLPRLDFKIKSYIWGITRGLTAEIVILAGLLLFRIRN